jgi:hypothetical protein
MHPRSSATLPTAWHVRFQQTSISKAHHSSSSSTTVTQLALAFQLDQPQHPQQQQVYAYLPLRSYGLRFVLQADWLVPSSRESVDADSCWNQALRDEIPGMLLAAMHAFMGLADSSSGSSDVGLKAAGFDRTLQQQPEERVAADVAAGGTVGARQQQQQGGSTAVGDAAGVSGAVPVGAVLPKLSREAWLDCWLRTLPLEGQAQGFFAALPHR